MLHPACAPVAAACGHRDRPRVGRKTPVRPPEFRTQTFAGALSSGFCRHLVVKPPHGCQHGIGRRRGEAEVDGRNPQSAHGAQILGDFRGAAGKQMFFAVVGLGGYLGAVAMDPIGERDARRIASGVLDELAQPFDRGCGSVHSARNACRYSSVTLPRSANGGAPSASNSSSSQPAPTPTMTRPPDITSMVDRIFAASTAGRCGTTITDVRNRMREVLAARYAMAESCSWRSPRDPLGNSPVSE